MLIWLQPPSDVVSSVSPLEDELTCTLCLSRGEGGAVGLSCFPTGELTCTLCLVGKSVSEVFRVSCLSLRGVSQLLWAALPAWGCSPPLLLPFLVSSFPLSLPLPQSAEGLLGSCLSGLYSSLAVRLLPFDDLG